MHRKLVERELSSEGPLRPASTSAAQGNQLRRGRGSKGKQRTVTVNIGESPLGWLHAHGHLDDRLFDAGERLRADYERAQLGQSVTMRWDPVRAKTTGDAGLTGAERQLAAKARFDGALAQAGKGLSDVLWRVVCACESIPDAERGLGWPARSGKLVLRMALDRVADFYRIR